MAFPCGMLSCLSCPCARGMSHCLRNRLILLPALPQPRQEPLKPPHKAPVPPLPCHGPALSLSGQLMLTERGQNKGLGFEALGRGFSHLWLPPGLPTGKAGWGSVVLVGGFVPAAWLAKEGFPRVSLLWEVLSLWLSGAWGLWGQRSCRDTFSSPCSAVSQPFLLVAAGIPLPFPATLR